MWTSHKERMTWPVKPTWLTGHVVFSILLFTVVGMACATAGPIDPIVTAQPKEAATVPIATSALTTTTQPSGLPDRENPEPETPTKAAAHDGAVAAGPGGGALSVRAEVVSSRLIVVDSDGSIIGVWSNSIGKNPDRQTLKVRRGAANGPVYPLTDRILSQYLQLEDYIDWSKRGRVYSRLR